MRGSDFAELIAFVAVAETRSFVRAASKLNLSRSALSHTIRTLEERVGTRLLNRTTRSVSLTDAGRTLYARLPVAFAEIKDAVDGLSIYSERPAGTIRLNLPRVAAEVLVASKLPAFATAYPAIHVELTVEDQLSDIVGSGYDAGVRPGGLLHQDMVAVRLTPDFRTAIVGSPTYFMSNPIPRMPKDLVGHSCINYRWTESGVLYQWPFGKAGEQVDVEVAGPLTMNDAGLTVAAALAGMGLACTLESNITQELAQGRLVRVLADWCPPSPGFYLYYPSGRLLSAAFRAFIDFMHCSEDVSRQAKVSME
ncbi:LysR family transcriptional regulator [Mesorhizobium sp. B2-4-19]|uniref:LysR family transcriptional regulator n=1 Tax=Mesorhizobium sp. B2-4-19 TaxID=2589930 RepID=UPI00112A3C97|nr:LysR family transcriptional regulator [Mesorhizobium sp. B2-4-19]TPK63033.1 LysR family transcriptional regulator [Mesorhizobium sp. B2-4-19]